MMSIIIQKFGGTSIATEEGRKKVLTIIKKASKKCLNWFENVFLAFFTFLANFLLHASDWVGVSMVGGGAIDRQTGRQTERQSLEGPLVLPSVAF